MEKNQVACDMDGVASISRGCLSKGLIIGWWAAMMPRSALGRGDRGALFKCFLKCNDIFVKESSIGLALFRGLSGNIRNTVVNSFALLGNAIGRHGFARVYDPNSGSMRLPAAFDPGVRDIPRGNGMLLFMPIK